MSSTKKTFSLLLTALCAVTLTSGPWPARAQLSAPPRPATAGGVSLGETENFIKNKIEAKGEVRAVMRWEDDTTNYTWSQGLVDSVEFDSCSMVWHSTLNFYPQGGSKKFDVRVDLRDAEGILISDFGEYLFGKDQVRSTKPLRLTMIMTPKLYKLTIKASLDNLYFVFSDHDDVTRVAKAFAHAIELCGGGKKGPF